MINPTQLFVADLLERFGFLWHPLNEEKGETETVVEISEDTVAKIQSLVGTVYRINRKGDTYIWESPEELAGHPP
jgi:hypothetical protein